MQRRLRPVSSGTDQYYHLVPTRTFIWYRPLLARVAPVLATAVGTYSDSKMLVSALALALATVTGLSLPDAGWLPIWESRRRGIGRKPESATVISGSTHG